MPVASPAFPSAPLATISQQDWFWSGGLIEISLVLSALLGAAWLVRRRG